VKLINKISQNLHTEMLLRTVARQSGVWATPDELMKVPVDFYARREIAPRRRNSSGRFWIVAARFGDSSSHCDVAELCAEAIVVQFLLCIAAGGGVDGTLKTA